MSIGSGLRSGLLSGLRSGLNPNVGDPFFGIDRDATSNIYVPASSAQWTQFLAAAGLSAWSVPDALHLCQEAAGNLADTMAGALTLTAANTPLYQQAAAGWSRQSAAMDDGTSDAFGSTAFALPNINTESMLMYAIVNIPTAAPAGTRNMICLGAVGTRAAAEFVVTDRVRAVCGANAAVGAVDPGGVRPVVCQVDQTANVMRVATDQEVLSPVFDAAVAGEQLRIGGVPTGNTAAGAGFLYVATWYLAPAERSQADIKALLQALGWAIPW